MTSTVLEQPIWQAAIADYQRRIRPWTDDRRMRAGRQKTNPVYDFLFDYYSFRPSHLMRWSPGADVLLRGAQADSFDGAQDFIAHQDGLILSAQQFPSHRLKYLDWAIRYLERTGMRAPHLSCFGLHEWAMVYQTTNIRYPDIPLRMTASKLREFCDSQGFRCTHYDANRFFSDAARPLNSLTLSRTATSINDQPGCIHVTMDLYRFAYKIAPFIPAELMADAFELAIAAREVDMRASPYDLSEFGFSPIKIEESLGRIEYVQHQQILFERALPIRSKILEIYQFLLRSKETFIPSPRYIK